MEREGGLYTPSPDAPGGSAMTVKHAVDPMADEDSEIDVAD